MLALWAGPALGVFVFGHIGQVGYLLLVLPAACLLLAMYVEAAGQRVAPFAQDVAGAGHGAAWRRVLAVGNVATVVLAAPTAHALLRDPVTASMVDVRDNDRFWTEVPTFVGRFTPQETIVLAEASPWGSFRHAGYYLAALPGVRHGQRPFRPLRLAVRVVRRPDRLLAGGAGPPPDAAPDGRPGTRSCWTRRS